MTETQATYGDPKKKKGSKAKAINIIISEYENPPSVDFIDIETDDGKSIKIGEQLEYGDYTKIRITAEDILKCES